jgi:hypothetical protein
MSLNWNVTDVKNYKRVVYKKSETDNPDEGFEMKHYPNRIIWATMAIGMSSITEENHVHFYNRLRLYEEFYGGYYKKVRNSHKVDFTPLKEVQKMIGLRVNVSNISATEFLKKFKKQF